MSGPREYRTYVGQDSYIEARLWEPKHPMGNIRISERDKRNGSPKEGDMLARDTSDHTNEWLIGEEYFRANYELMTDPAAEPKNRSKAK